MPIEVEQKYRIEDASAVLEVLTRIGAQSQHVVHQTDMYYAHPNRDFAATDEALRIRRVGESNFITYKGPKLDATTKTRREIELPLASGASSAAGFDELLEALSFRRVAEVSKIRQIYHLEREGVNVEISLDQVSGVGSFVEIEIIVDDDAKIEPAQRLLSDLANELQLARAQRRSYLELLLGS